jgi:hypothetical protein
MGSCGIDRACDRDQDGFHMNHGLIRK